jgi:flavodoxin
MKQLKLLLKTIPLFLTFACFLLTILAGPALAQGTSPSGEAASGGSKVLVAYFSQTGNTEAVANQIVSKTGATLYRITTVKPYPDNYSDCTRVAKQEQNDNARPELATHVADMASYDIIFLGYPNWWGTIPMALFTFLEEYDLTGKIIIPFCTHDGSALGRSERDITALAPNSTIKRGLAIRGSRARQSESDIDKWLAGLEVPLK